MIARSILATEQDLKANGLGLGVERGQGYDSAIDEGKRDGKDEDEDEDNETNNSYGNGNSLVVPVSAATGAGVQRLWLRLLHHARLTTQDHIDNTRSATTTSDSPSQIPSQTNDLPSQTNPFAVREHRNAALLRKQDYLRQLSRFRKAERVG